MAALERTPTHSVLPQVLSKAALAKLMAESLRQAANSAFGLYRLGGVRAAMPPGPVLYSDVVRALPFDDTLVILHLSGAALEALVLKLGPSSTGQGAALAGLRLVGSASQGERSRLVQSNGQALGAHKIYSLATDSFVLEDPKSAHYRTWRPEAVTWPSRPQSVRLIALQALAQRFGDRQR